MTATEEQAARRIHDTIGGHRVDALVKVDGPLARYAVSKGTAGGQLDLVEASAGAPARGRVLRDANLLKMIDSPCVPRVLDEGTDSIGATYLVTDLRGAGALDRLAGPIGVGEAIAIGQHVAAALGAVHAAGIVHATVCPAHLFLGHDGIVRLFDFGRSILLASRGASSGHTHEPAFEAPEISADRANVDARSDVYSLGATLFFLLSGRPPGTTPPSIGRFVRDLSPYLVTLIDRALSIDPAHRWASAREVAAMLSWIATGRDDVTLAALASRIAAPAAPSAPTEASTGTVIGGARPGVSTLPFAAGTVDKAALFPPASQPAAPSSTGTVFGGRVERPALPFGGGPLPAPPAPAPPPPPSAPHVPSSAPHAAPPVQGDDTLRNEPTGAVGQGTIFGVQVAAAPLPFDPTRSSAPDAPRVQAAVATPSSTGTVFGASVGRPALPFGAKPPPHVPPPSPEAAAPQAPGLLSEQVYIAVKTAVMQGDRSLPDVLDEMGIDEIVWHKHEAQLRAAVAQEAERGRTDRAFDLSRGVRAALDDKEKG